MQNLHIKFQLRDNFDLIIETKPTELVHKTIKKFQDNLKQTLTGKLDTYPFLKHLYNSDERTLKNFSNFD